MLEFTEIDGLDILVDRRSSAKVGTLKRINGMARSRIVVRVDICQSVSATLQKSTNTTLPLICAGWSFLIAERLAI